MECASPKPPLPGEVARRSRDGEVAANLIQPLSQPSAASSPARGALPPRRANPSDPSGQLPLTRGALVPRKKVKLIKISAAPSIDGNRSKATSHKLDAPVSGGAYQDARKVSLVWNARPKHWNPPEFKCRKHPTVTQRPFSPPSFPARRKRRGRRRRVRNDHDGTSRRKRRLFSSVLVSSFPNRKRNLRFGFFYANQRQPLGQPSADSSPERGAFWGA